MRRGGAVAGSSHCPHALAPIGVAPTQDGEACRVVALKGTAIASKGAIRQVRQRRLRTRLGETPPLPEGVFQVIQADPPWASGNPDSDWAPENHYPTMSLEEIKAFPVPAADDAALYLWALGCQLPQALEVMAAWDFRYVGQIIWVKDSIGLGTWVRYRHEPLLIGIRGRMAAPPPALRPDSVIVAPRRKHSQSPTRPTS